jgi:hypothetical protein
MCRGIKENMLISDEGHFENHILHIVGERGGTERGNDTQLYISTILLPLKSLLEQGLKPQVHQIWPSYITIGQILIIAEFEVYAQLLPFV